MAPAHDEACEKAARLARKHTRSAARAIQRITGRPLSVEELAELRTEIEQSTLTWMRAFYDAQREQIEWIDRFMRPQVGDRLTPIEPLPERFDRPSLDDTQPGFRLPKGVR